MEERTKQWNKYKTKQNSFEIAEINLQTPLEVANGQQAVALEPERSNI